MVNGLNALKIEIPEGLKHFLNSEDRNAFIYHNRSDDTESKMDIILKEAKKLKDLCRANYDESNNYLTLIRVLKEQTVEQDGKLRLLTPKDGVMDSNIIQNPADPDAKFRRKAGINHRGYARICSYIA